jgi:SNF2 family DNA or RNA helicase
VRLLKQIEDMLKVHMNVSYAFYTGEQSMQQKDAAINTFWNDSECFFFLVGLKAGNTGLNLQIARNVIVYDIGWNPASVEQAENRAHRLGSPADVQVFKYIYSGTLDEQQYARQFYKQTTTTEVDNWNLTGIHGREEDKGDLFGMANLLSLSAGGSFFAQVRTEMCFTLSFRPAFVHLKILDTLIM